MKRLRLASAIAAAVAAGGADMAVALAACGSSRPSSAAPGSAGTGAASGSGYSYYRSMMGSRYGGSMMGGTSAPAWMRGSARAVRSESRSGTAPVGDEFRVAAGGHGMLMRGGGNHGGASHGTQYSRRRTAPLGGKLGQLPGGGIDHDLEVGQAAVGGGEPVRARREPLERISCDHEQAQRAGHSGLTGGRAGPADAQLEQLLLHDRRCAEQPA